MLRKTLGKEQSKNEFTLSTNFKKSVDKFRQVCYNKTVEREGTMMMNEKMDLILYMIENGYEGENLYALTLAEIRKIAVEFFGEDPTA